MAYRGRIPLNDIGNTLDIRGQNREICPREELRSIHSRPAPYRARSPRVDESRKGNPLNVSEYASEIMQTLRLNEVKFMASPTYMSRQKEINERMRAILVDWLVDVHLKFKLVPETLYLSTSLIDRFLDQKLVTRSKLQLVGVVAMLLAAKYEEIYPPEIRDFIYISANTYTRTDILTMERLMLTAIEFNMTSPSIYPFVRRALQVVEADQMCQHMALYISEMALLEYRMIQYPPSVLAAGCVYLARKLLQHTEPWNWTLEHYTSHSMASLQPVVLHLHELVQGARQNRCQAVFKKYSYPRYSGVSELTDIPITFP